MITIRNERSTDISTRERLLDAPSGRRASPRLRSAYAKAVSPAEALSFAATENGRLVGTVRLWNVNAGLGRPALLLGPLAVASNARSRGIGAALMRRALREAKRLGHQAVLLVGDAPYYGRFGFSAEAAAGLRLAGPLRAAPPARSRTQARRARRCARLDPCVGPSHPEGTCPTSSPERARPPRCRLLPENRRT